VRRLQPRHHAARCGLSMQVRRVRRASAPGPTGESVNSGLAGNTLTALPHSRQRHITFFPRILPEPLPANEVFGGHGPLLPMLTVAGGALRRNQGLPGTFVFG
jgi:hypothetical protein